MSSLSSRPYRSKNPLARKSGRAASSKSLEKAIRLLLPLGENGSDMSLPQVASLSVGTSPPSTVCSALQKALHARMKIDLVKTVDAKLSKLFSRGPAEFATISPPYV
jgi:hypothetical protein